MPYQSIGGIQMYNQSINIQDGIALTILFLYRNIEEESCMEKLKKTW